MLNIPNYIFKFLLFLIVIILFLPLYQSFFFPMELEVRESTLWLHILTIKEGINIYNQDLVAYANQAHGPIDPLFKLIIHKIFFFFEPWQVSRLNNILLFGSIFYVNFKTLGKKKNSLSIIFLSIKIYSLIFLFTKTFQGRADITAMLLIVCLVYICSDHLFYKKNFKLIFSSFLFSLIILTNWRFLPVCLAIIFYPLILEDKLKDIFSLHKIYIFLKIVFFVSLPFFLILYLYFDLSLENYFIGFFYFESFFNIKHFFTGLLNLLRVEKLYILILLILFYLIKFRKTMDLGLKFILKIFVCLLVFISCLISYLYNYVGGGIYYFTPVILFLWYLIIFEYRNNYFTLRRDHIINLVIIIISLIIISASLKNSFRSYKKMADNYDNALKLNLYLKDLHNSKKKILSESLHFHKKNYSGEKIDIGDLISYRAFQVGGNYKKTYLDHLDDINSKKFDFIIHNYTGSKNIDNLIKNNDYEIIKKFKYDFSNIGEILILKKIN